MIKIKFITILVSLSCITIFTNHAIAQCCAGGSGSPIAGGASQGVLLDRQIELSTNFQFISTNKFYSKDSHSSSKTFDSYLSTYEYFRVSYGLTKNFTMSVESGYYFNKKEVGLENDPVSTYESKGFSDLILFPRYDVINWTEEKHRTEVTIGIGSKIPLGTYNDSAGITEPFSGQTYYITKPTAVQLSSGAHDLIFYTFFYRGYTDRNFRIFANAYYIKKGYNPNGEKLGDYTSISLFAGKTFFENLGLTLQARYEWTDKMKINESIFLYGSPSNYNPEATGYKKVFITPQVSYSKGKFSIYASTDFPVYQYLNTSRFYTQVGSQHQVTTGISYRFFATGSPLKNFKSTNTYLKGTNTYYCPMHEEVTSDKPGKCPTCGMALEKTK